MFQTTHDKSTGYSPRGETRPSYYPFISGWRTPQLQLLFLCSDIISFERYKTGPATIRLPDEDVTEAWTLHKRYTNSYISNVLYGICS